MTFKNYIAYPKTAKPISLQVRQVGIAYNFPMGDYSGKGAKIGIIELGGGFKATQVDTWFSANNLPTPKINSIAVDGGKNKQDGPDGADGEVQLDIIVALGIAYGATANVYFAPNSNDGFLAAIKQAIADGCTCITISWGQAESGWDSDTMNEFSAVITAARKAGIPVFVAAGDSGSTDSTDANATDFPASAPDSIGCGGTRLEVTSAGTRSSETVWDDSDTSSATGGGVSKQFPGRQVPDIAGNADPDSGYIIDIDGETNVVIGGTSAVAPLMAGLYALLWEANGSKAFDFAALVAANPTAFFDVTQGDNGGFRAGPGRDDTTGWGVPDGAKLLAALNGSAIPPINPTPPVTPVDPTPPTTGGQISGKLSGTFVGTLSSQTGALTGTYNGEYTPA